MLNSSRRLPKVWAFIYQRLVTTRPQSILVGIVVLAILLRLAYVFFFGSTLNLQLSGYDTYATNLLAGHGYTRFADYHPDSNLPPLYPLFLVCVYSLLGRSSVSVALVQIGLDCITIVAIYAIGKKMGGQAVGLFAAGFTAFYPYLLFQNLSANDTALFIALLTMAILVVYCAQERRNWRWALVAGLLFGLAALTKTLVLLALPFIVVWWWRRLGWRITAGLSIALAIGVAAFPAPWIIRNTLLYHSLTLITTNDGSNLHQGNNVCTADYLLAGYDAQWTTDTPRCGLIPPEGLTDMEQENWHRSQAIAYIRDHISNMPRLFAIKLLNLWSFDITPRSVPTDARLDDPTVLEYNGPIFTVARLIHLAYFGPLLLLSFVGLRSAWRDQAMIGPILSVVMAVTITYLIFHPSTRYRSPADPFVFILSAYGVVWMAHKFRVSRLADQDHRMEDILPGPHPAGDSTSSVA